MDALTQAQTAYDFRAPPVERACFEDVTYPARWRNGHVHPQVRCRNGKPIGIVNVWMYGYPKDGFDEVAIDVTTWFNHDELTDFLDQFNGAPHKEWTEAEECDTFFP